MTRAFELLSKQQSVDEDENETSEEIETEEEIINFDHTIYHMQCAEYPSQLEMRDGLKKKRLEKFLSKIRKIAQFLPSYHTDID